MFQKIVLSQDRSCDNPDELEDDNSFTTKWKSDDDRNGDFNDNHNNESDGYDKYDDYKDDQGSNDDTQTIAMLIVMMMTKMMITKMTMVISMQ